MLQHRSGAPDDPWLTQAPIVGSLAWIEVEWVSAICHTIVLEGKVVSNSGGADPISVKH